MEKRNKIYEGKAKIIYETDDPDLVIQYFKDETTCYNAAKRGTVEDKGILNNKISAKIFEFLTHERIPNHYQRILNDREMLVKRVEIIPLEVVVRNRACGSLCRRLGTQEGIKFSSPILEFCYKRDDLNDPMINEYHIRALHLASDQEVEIIKNYTFRIEQSLTKYFADLKVELIDFKVEFGRYKDEVILADEISPDTCRLWEMGTGFKLDKDRFRHDMGNIKEAYQEVLTRVSR